MSKSFEVFSGTFVGVAKISAKAGKGDAVAQALAAIKASATSAAEPGCLGYHIVRFQEEFIVFEKYTSVSALKEDHANTEPAKALLATRGDIIEEYKLQFYEEL